VAVPGTEYKVSVFNTGVGAGAGGKSSTSSFFLQFDNPSTMNAPIIKADTNFLFKFFMLIVLLIG
jgi:hypothetical protein